jgi:SAM-dependent methyltransferase
MSSVAEHYDRLLSKHYSWMVGTSHGEKVAEQKALLEPELKGIPSRRLAVDLGCGPGFQSVALAGLGFSRVIAIDTSAGLLCELRTHSANLPIEVRHDDILNLSQCVSREVACVIVCMGDTITHLPTLDDVSKLFECVAAALAPGGIFVLTWRDLTPELHGVDRFIPVRSDDNTIFTCFLEYPTPEIVQVHDLVYTREGTGWTLNKSSYPKLRLTAEVLSEQLAASGLLVDASGAAGRLSKITARKPRLG